MQIQNTSRQTSKTNFKGALNIKLPRDISDRHAIEQALYNVIPPHANKSLVAAKLSYDLEGQDYLLVTTGDAMTKYKEAMTAEILNRKTRKERGVTKQREEKIFFPPFIEDLLDDLQAKTIEGLELLNAIKEKRFSFPK